MAMCLSLLSCSKVDETETNVNTNIETRSELDEINKSISNESDSEPIEVTPSNVAKREHGHIVWDKTYGGYEDDYLSSIVLTPDGGALLAGKTSSKGAGHTDMYLVRVDKEGNQLWDKTYGGVDKEDVASIVLTPDGGALLAGMFRSKDSIKPGMYLIKVDENGEQLWDNNYGTSNYDALSSIALTPDGGALLGGTSRPEGRTVSDMYLVKIDQNGNQLWDKSYGNVNEADYITSLAVTPDGVLLGGFTLKGQRDFEMYLVKVNLDGTPIWEKHYGANTNEEFMWSIAPTKDGGALLGGTTESIEANNQDMYLVRINKNGEQLWEKTYGGSNLDGINTIINTPDEGALIGGTTKSKGVGSTDMYLVKVDKEGNQVWDETYGDIGPNQIKSFVLTPDGGALLGGESSTKGAGGYDMYLAKVDNIEP